MAETTPDLRGLPKARAYSELSANIDAVLAGIHDEIAEMATIATLIHHGFGHLWTGFYRVTEAGKQLLVGPYQGTLGCIEIGFGRGVCGTAAAEGRTIVVPDVNEFPGHIACDARARSEVVVPVFGPSGALIAVLDIDSDRPGTFDDEDGDALARIVRRFARR